MKRRLVFQAVSTAVMLIGLFAAIVLCKSLIIRQRAEILRAAAAETEHISIGLKAGLQESFEHLHRLGRWWLSQGKPFDLEDWRTDGQLFLSRSPGLRWAAWVGADGLQHWSAEPGAEPDTRRIRPDSRVGEVVGAARSHDALTTSQIVSAPDMMAALYVCMPLGDKGSRRGYLVGLYDASELVSSIARSVVRHDQAVSISSGGREIFSMWSEAAPDPEEYATAALELPDQKWTVALRVPFDYFREFSDSIITVIGVIGALIYSFIMLLYLSQRRSSELERANAALYNEVCQRTRIESEVRELNNELNHKVADFQTLVDVIPIGIAVAADAECRNIEVNPTLADMLGMPRAAGVSKVDADAARSPYRLFREGRELRPDELPMQVAAATGRKILGEEERILRADGSTIDVLSFAAPVFDRDGRVRGVLSALVDISHRKAEEQLRRDLERRLQRAERMKSLGVMAGGIAHRFNNLLMNVIGRATLAMDTLHSTAEAQAHLADSIRSAQQAADLIHQILAYTGRTYRRRQPIDLGDIVRDMRPSLLDMSRPNIQMRFDIPCALPKIMAAPDEVQHVLRQLVLNAVEAMEAGGSIDISVDNCELSGNELGITPQDAKIGCGTYVRVKVEDNGPGMAAAIVEKAFDPFFSTKFQGRGLGLSVVLGVMRGHNGAVRLETSQRSGTAAELFFPAENRPAIPAVL
jgi:PAS domain S-box-containing protein